MEALGYYIGKGFSALEERSFFKFKGYNDATYDVIEKVLLEMIVSDKVQVDNVEYASNGHLDIQLNNGYNRDIGTLRVFSSSYGFHHIKNVTISKLKTLISKYELLGGLEALGGKQIPNDGYIILNSEITRMTGSNKGEELYIFDNIDINSILNIEELGLITDVRLDKGANQINCSDGNDVARYAIHISISINKDKLCDYHNQSTVLESLEYGDYFLPTSRLSRANNSVVKSNWKLGYNTKQHMFAIVNELKLFRNTGYPVVKYISICIEV